MMKDREIAVKIAGVKKQYKLGQIGGGTLQADLQSWWAKKRGREDPNTKIGEKRLVGETFMALNGIDLTIYKGERIGIIGRNGAGKSTLLKLLSRVTAPTDGDIDIYGRIASMLEVGTGFNGEMTGRENIYMNGSILGMTKAEIDRKIEDIIDFSEVREFIDTPVKRYSSGMYVKLAFSVAAHLDAEIMIMDEVLAVGDMAFQKKCLDKMSQVSADEGRTILYVSHNMNTIRRLCDRCIVLEEGKVIFDGDVEKAIELYLSESKDREKIKNHYFYDDSYRYLEWGSRKLQIQELFLDNRGFECGEKFPVVLKIKSEKNWNNVFFRFEISLTNETRIAAMLSNRGIDFQSNEEKQLTFVLDTAHLTPAKYRVDLIAYMTNSLGEDRFIDGVYPAFMFRITDKINEYNEKVWNQKYWGPIHLQDVEVKETNRVIVPACNTEK